VQLEGFGRKNPSHWDAILRPSGLQHSASTTIKFPYLETDKNEESSDNTSWLQGDGYPA
jgi:hypothetical protein